MGILLHRWVAPGGDGGDSVGGRERGGRIVLEMASLVKESEEGSKGRTFAIEGYGGEVVGLLGFPSDR